MKRNRLGITLIIVGIAGAAILALLGGMSESQSVASFGRANVGCRTMFQFDKPGTYYIFVETGGLRVIDPGCPPSASSDELVLSLYADSTPVPLVPDASVGYDYDGASAVSTSRFELQSSGRFELIAVGPDVKQVVALGADPAIARRPWWFAAGMALAIGVLGGMVLVLWARSGRTKSAPAAAGSTSQSADRPRLPASSTASGTPKVSPRPSLPKGGVTGQIPAVKPKPAAAAQPIPPIVAVADTPTGQSRPRTEPVVSSGSTAGATDRRGGSGRRGRRRRPDDWDLIDDVSVEATVGDALDDDGPIAPTRPRTAGGRRPSRPVDDHDDYDEYDEYDDYDDGEFWDDGFDDVAYRDGARRGSRSNSRTVADAFDELDDDGYPRRPTRSRRRIPARYDYEPDIVEDQIDDEFDDYADDYDAGVFDSADSAGREYVEAYLDDGYDDDYLGGARMDPPKPRAPRRSRPARTAQRSQRRGRQSAPSARPTRRATPAGQFDTPDPDDDRFDAGRSLPEQRRTQPRRRRTPTPPPPPGDEWEELPPPTKSHPNGPTTTDGAVVSDEWATDGDDTGAWRWWSPPDPNERAQR